MGVSFWDSFFDSDYRQRSDINDLRDQLAIASDTSHVVQATSVLSRQIQDLSVLVSMLVRLLEESGHVDGKMLRYRVEAQLESMAAARAGNVTSFDEALRSGGGANQPAQEAPSTAPTKCSKCGQMVPANRTTITESGTLCDQCAST